MYKLANSQYWITHIHACMHARTGIGIWHGGTMTTKNDSMDTCYRISFILVKLLLLNSHDLLAGEARPF